MEIIEKYGIDEASSCEGQVVVIDVLRAFTTAAYAFSKGAEKIIVVGTPEEAFAIKSSFTNVLLVGENRGRMIEGFDFGNSPEAMESLDLRGKTIILRSSSGAQGVVSAKNAKQIYLGSLVVSRATAEHLKAINQTPVTLIAMGSKRGPDKDEDIACRDYLSTLLKGNRIELSSIRERVIQSPAGKQALDPTVDFISPGDLERAVAIDKFNFSMPVTIENGLCVARKCVFTGSEDIVSLCEF